MTDAQKSEAKLLSDYGLDEGSAARLIQAVRDHGGLDRYLREQARETGDETIYRTVDPPNTTPETTPKSEGGLMEDEA
jgi:hypothetical protein